MTQSAVRRQADRRVRSIRRWGALAIVASLAWVTLAGGCIDTELSVDLQVLGGEVVVPDDGSLDATVEMEVRVGRYALSGDDVSLSRVGIFFGGDPVAELVPMRPEGFDGRIEPGERRRITLRSTSPAGSYPAARALLCAGGDAISLVSWTAEQQPDDPLDPPLMSFGSAEGAITIRCP